MRLAGQAKLGFYPAAPEAVDGILWHLDADPGASVLDPCCGEGAALTRLALGLRVGPGDTYGCELDPERARLAAQATGGPTIHADFKSVKCSPGSFGLAYVNPPFDGEIGGGRREEAAFLSRACPLVVPGGVVCLVLPEDTLRWDSDVYQTAAAWLDDIGVYRFPEGHRPYKETALLGVRRKLPETPRVDRRGWFDLVDRAPELGTDDRRWAVPAGRRPRVFEKGGFTEAELHDAIRSSRLRGMLEAHAQAVAPSPPLPLASGHVSLLLAGGMLDGLVRPEGEPPFVVRGSARKEQYLDAAKCSATEDDKGNITEKTVFSERVVLEVRTASGDGTLRTFR